MVDDHVDQNVIMVADQRAPDDFQPYSLENGMEGVSQAVSHINGVVEVADQLTMQDMSTLPTVSELTPETPQLGSNDISSSNKGSPVTPAGQETVIDLVDSDHVVVQNSTNDRLTEVVLITSESDDEGKLRSKNRKGRRQHNVKACIVNLVQEGRRHRKRLRKKHKTHPQVIAERILDHDLIDLTKQCTEPNAPCRYTTGQKRKQREPAKLATKSAAGDDPCHSDASTATESISISHINGSFSLDSSNFQSTVVVESSRGSAFPVSTATGLAVSPTTGGSNVDTRLNISFDGVRPENVTSRTITNGDGLLAGAIPVKIGFPDSVPEGLSSISDFLKKEKVAVSDRSFQGKSSATRSKSRMSLPKARSPDQRYPPRYHPGNLSEMWLKAESDRLSAADESDDESLLERRLKRYRKRARRIEDSDPQIAIKRPRTTSANVATYSDGTLDDANIESTPCPASSSDKDEEDDVDVGYQPLPLFGRAQVHQVPVRRFQKPTSTKRQPVNDKLYDVRANLFTGVEFAVVGCGQVSIWTSIPGKQTKMKRKWDLSKQMPLNPLVYAGIDLVHEPPDVFCCDWLYDEKEAKCHIAAGGSDGFLMVFDADSGEYKHLHSHGSHVNDIKTHPKDPLLFATASCDLSARLWNGKTGHVIAIFMTATEFQRMGLLSLAWHHTGKKLLVGEKDGTVRLWNTDTRSIRSAIAYSYQGQPSSLPPAAYYRGRINRTRRSSWKSSSSDRKDKQPASLAFEKIPIMSSPYVWHGYVDWVQWWGDLCLAKSTESCIRMFQPEIERRTKLSNTAKRVISQDIFYCHQFEYPEQDDHSLWFVRATLSPSGRYLAVGNMMGEIYIWDIPYLLQLSVADKIDDIAKKDDPTGRMRVVIGGPKKPVQIRALAFARDETILMAVTDDARIIRWDVIGTL
ncbi:uncharacterized protein SPPG_00068 [Spizellomyces punctatus DAOM BR117]|uniref:Uncharacterized protein n=1 Tax=Spizellomyces punctatus (strain DAOM BR117) TaxID=645134 RepID=A0A0L0HTA5_SPIPD|nr:uncharacterized protein SPPG_00068 [Spizellomyces punctatus DAOM BR117]KND04337.1 hypothetical protein SPPG_00068 [Spizellomyces punctatus DAOM BR117]|eukprot:XP_016612376.1 hypothetical protein SPPG_00068 [Spizellomyces punctatus DAOM BR117]